MCALKMVPSLSNKQPYLLVLSMYEYLHSSENSLRQVASSTFFVQKSTSIALEGRRRGTGNTPFYLIYWPTGESFTC